jgi:CRP-like cAMP-binding protein
MTRDAPALPPALREIASTRTLARGEQLFRAGSPASHLFHLAEGSIRLVRFGPGGEEISIHQARPAEFFAEASLHAKRYHCTAIANVASVVVVLPAREVERLLATDPAFADDWIRLLARQLRASRTRVERLCLRSARERVRHLLLTEGTGPCGRFVPSGTLKELALQLGLTHEALYRTLAAMRRSGELVAAPGALQLAGDAAPATVGDAARAASVRGRRPRRCCR